ncbi:MAG: antibiotic biosynthesis monooxygenase [Desulfofustis sp.]|nr:antibiotic biosynthesis monooxygenase [Desulfofustis sp.]
MIHVIASVSIRQGSRSEFLEIFKANVPNVLAEQGCIEYRPAVDVAAGLDPQVVDENLVTVIEKWESLDHLRAHLSAPHMLDYREKVSSMVEAVELKVLEDV